MAAVFFVAATFFLAGAAFAVVFFVVVVFFFAGIICFIFLMIRAHYYIKQIGLKTRTIYVGIILLYNAMKSLVVRS